MEFIQNFLDKFGVRKNLILFILCLGILVLFIIKDIADRKRNKVLKQIKQKKNAKNYLYPLYFIYTNTPFLRKSFEKIKKQIMLAFPGEIIEINLRATKQMTLGLGVSLISLIIFIATSNKDLFYICFGFVMTYVLFNHIIVTQSETSDQLLKKQFKTFLTDVRHNFYTNNKKVDEAVYSSINESPYEISLHATKIYNILHVPDYETMQKEVDRYVSVAPNRFLLSFVAIATSLMEYGDKVLENGKSMFLTALSFLKDEVHIELEKIKVNTQMFKWKPFICVAPILAIKPIQGWVNVNCPEISGFYTGVYGMTCEVILFLLVIGCYQMVMNLKDLSQREIKEHKLLRRISNIPFIKAILVKETNRNYSKSQRINDKLKLTGEHMGYSQFLLKRILFAIAFFIGFQVIIVTAQWQEKRNILNDYTEAFATSFISNDETREEMVEAAKTYIRSKEITKNNFDVDKVTEEIRVSTPIKKPLLAEMVAQLVVEKINKYNNVYYRWYFLLISVALAVLGYQIPMLMLNSQIKNINMSMEDEVSQYQTIVMMLMHVDGISIKTMLEWMERFAYCFKESIQTCINELPRNEEQALKKLRDSETFYPFKRFINNFLCVNEQGMVAAFDEIVSDRENSMEERKSNNEITGRKKSGKSTVICVIPTAFYFIFYVMYPLMVYINDSFSLMGMY